MQSGLVVLPVTNSPSHSHNNSGNSSSGGGGGSNRQFAPTVSPRSNAGSGLHASPKRPPPPYPQPPPPPHMSSQSSLAQADIQSLQGQKTVRIELYIKRILNIGQLLYPDLLSCYLINEKVKQLVNY